MCRRLQTADKSAGVTTAHCLDIAADIGESCWLGDAVVVVSLWPSICLIKKKNEKHTKCTKDELKQPHKTTISTLHKMSKYT